MRVTQLEISRNLLTDLENLNRNFVDVNRQLSSGKKLNFLGDSPIGSTDLVNITEQAQRLDAYRFNIIASSYQLKSSESALNAVYNGFVSIHTLGMNAANETTSKDGRTAILNEILILREELIAKGNTQVNGFSIFAGTAVDVKEPFVLAKVNAAGEYEDKKGNLILDEHGAPILGTIGDIDGRVFYLGNDNVNKIPVSDGVEVFAGVSGNEAMGAVFMAVDNLIEKIRNSIQVDGDLEEISKALNDFGVNNFGGALGALSELNNARGKVGVNLGAVERISATIEARNVVLTEQRSKIEDANALEVALRISQLQIAQNAATASGAAIIQQKTLFDIIG